MKGSASGGDPQDERFWAKVNRNGECWEWMGEILPSGYGRFRTGGGRERAHRYSYTRLVGPIPEGLVIDHLCRNKPCVNPDHLEAVSQKVNAQRGNTGLHMREKSKEITHCPRGHEYSEENTRINKRGSRVCRRCDAEYRAKRQKTARSRTEDSDGAGVHAGGS